MQDSLIDGISELDKRLMAHKDEVIDNMQRPMKRSVNDHTKIRTQTDMRSKSHKRM